MSEFKLMLSRIEIRKIRPALDLLKQLQKICRPNQKYLTKRPINRIASSATTSHKSHVEFSKYLSASVTSSQKSRELKIATLRCEEIEQRMKLNFA